MKLVAYQISGQTIGVDIKVWENTILSGNTAFIAIADTGSTPSDYVDISSVDNWDDFGGFTTLSVAEIKSEIIKLIPDVPTSQQLAILENYAYVGLNSVTNIDNSFSMGTNISNGYLSGVTDTKFNVTGGTIDGDIKTTGVICGINGTLDVGGNFNVGGNMVGGGCLTIGGNVLIGGTGVVTSASNIGTGEGVFSSLSAKDLRFKSLSAGTNVSLNATGDTIVISAAGGTGGTSSWGSITGTLSDQTDLQNALDAKTDASLFNTYTGTTAPATYALITDFNQYTGMTAPTTFALKTDAVTGATNVGTGEGLYTGITGNLLQIKSLIAGSNITLTPAANSITIAASGGGTGGTPTTYSTTSTGAVTTTSATDALMDAMQITNVPAGNYFLNFGTSFNHSSNGSYIYTNIYVGGAAVTGSEQAWKRGNAQGDVASTHNYAGFPITLATTATVEIYWRTDGATATSTNRYMSLIQV